MADLVGLVPLVNHTALSWGNCRTSRAPQDLVQMPMERTEEAEA